MKGEQLVNLLMCRGDLSRADARQVIVLHSSSKSVVDPKFPKKGADMSKSAISAILGVNAIDIILKILVGKGEGGV
jgi:hypothetical protein